MHRTTKKLPAPAAASLVYLAARRAVATVQSQRRGECWAKKVPESSSAEDPWSRPISVADHSDYGPSTKVLVSITSDMVPKGAEISRLNNVASSPMLGFRESGVYIVFILGCWTSAYCTRAHKHTNAHQRGDPCLIMSEGKPQYYCMKREGLGRILVMIPGTVLPQSSTSQLTHNFNEIRLCHGLR